jgi:hypothetical protein
LIVDIDSASCSDVESGERGTFTSPWSGFLSFHVTSDVVKD